MGMLLLLLSLLLCARRVLVPVLLRCTVLLLVVLLELLPPPSVATDRVGSVLQLQPPPPQLPPSVAMERVGGVLLLHPQLPPSPRAIASAAGAAAAGAQEKPVLASVRRHCGPVTSFPLRHCVIEYVKSGFSLTNSIKFNTPAPFNNENEGGPLLTCGSARPFPRNSRACTRPPCSWTASMVLFAGVVVLLNTGVHTRGSTQPGQTRSKKRREAAQPNSPRCTQRGERYIY
jgi:hypothetical protein